MGSPRADNDREGEARFVNARHYSPAASGPDNRPFKALRTQAIARQRKNLRRSGRKFSKAY